MASTFHRRALEEESPVISCWEGMPTVPTGFRDMPMGDSANPSTPSNDRHQTIRPIVGKHM